MPWGFVARTSNECSPLSTTQKAWTKTPSTVPEGTLQGTKSAPSSEHSKVTPGWSAVYVKTAFSVLLRGSAGSPVTGWIRPFGPVRIETTGAAAIVTALVAGSPMLPARSTARMATVYAPGSRPLMSKPPPTCEEHGSHSALAMPTAVRNAAHSNSSRRTGVALSEPANWYGRTSSPTVAPAAGPAVIVTLGPRVSATGVHVWNAGVGSGFPSNSGCVGSGNSGSYMSTARTQKVCSVSSICGSSYW